MSKCLICGSNGWDLVFYFYCSNKKCQNFNIKCVEKEECEDTKSIIRAMWKMYGREESEDEFKSKFFSEGGIIKFPPSKIGAGFVKITKPKWLKRRIAHGI